VIVNLFSILVNYSQFGKIFITGLAAAILDFRVVMEWQRLRHFVAPSYLGKVTKAQLLTPSGLEMATKRSAWG
jgi:hypothetical protein